MATWFGLARLIGNRVNRRRQEASAAAGAAAKVESLEQRMLLSASVSTAAAAAAPASSANSAKTISFTQTQRILNVTGFTGYIATGDFTGNGLTDFASTVGVNNDIFIYLNNGDNTFTHSQTYHVNDPRGIIAGDFLHNGILDLAVVAENSTNTINASNATLFMLFGNGDGTFSAPVRIAKTRLGFGAITSADFNHDGLLDIAVTNRQAVSIYVNQGNGAFSSAVRFSTGIGNAAYLSAEDLNGDSIPDLVVGKGVNPYVSVLLAQTINGQATGAFEPFARYKTRHLPISVAVGDLGTSGLPDIVVGNNGFHQGISVLMNNGNGTFAPQTVYQAGNFVRYVTTGDFSNDGTVDIAATDFDGPLEVFPNQGDGTFATPQTFFSGQFGDFLVPINLGNGVESILVSHGGDISVLLNTTPA